MNTNSLIKPLQVVAVVSETQDAKTFVLDSTPHELSYNAGQFLTLVFNTPHGEKRRSYSFSSSPGIDALPCITVKKVDNGEFSRQLLSHVKPGDTLYTSGVGGFFTLPATIDNVHAFCFLAAGSGITPCYALIKTLLATTTKKIVLIFSNKYEEDAIFLSSIRQLEKEYNSRFSVEYLFSNRYDIQHSRLGNFLLQELLNKYFSGVEQQTMFYMCGPHDYMLTITITLLSAGVPAANLKKEIFNSLPRQEKPKPPDLSAHTVTIHINNSIQEVTVQYPHSILAAAKQENVAMPFSCEAGRCGSCAATCTSGELWMAYNEVLTDDEVAKGRVLTCQAFAINGDATVVF